MMRKKLQKAEFRAAQKKRRQEPKSFGKKKFKHGFSDSSNPMQSNVVFPCWSQGAAGFGPVGQPIQRVPGRVAQSVTCLATDACLTADPGVASSIPVRSHTFVEIDHEIISTVILLPSADLFMKGCCQLQAKVCARITG